MDKFVKKTIIAKPTIVNSNRDSKSNININKISQTSSNSLDSNKKEFKGEIDMQIPKRFTFSLEKETKRINIDQNKILEIGKLTSSQKKALENISLGKNIFLTGEAGTGKSYLVNRLKEISKSQAIKLAVTALTGTAAYLLGGTTLHAWAGIGLGKDDIKSLIVKINKSKNAQSKWKEVDILVIDEISMMSSDLLDKLEKLARFYRDPNKIFGGIQVIIIGDFYQLPPVCCGNDKINFCFKADCWKKLIDINIVLEEVVRQSDPLLKKCLSEIRRGIVSKETLEVMKSRIAVKLPESSITPTRLYPNKSNVEAINSKNLVKLGGKLKSYKLSINVTRQGKPYTSYNGYEIERLIKHITCEDKLTISVGAQVMLIYNLDMESGLVNGSRGIVLETNKNNVKVQFINGEVREIERQQWIVSLDNQIEITFSQIPLILAWAITVHKSQGASLDLAEIDAGMTIFEYGQAYVALSRIKSLEGLRLIAFDHRKIRANPEVTKFYQSIN